jgi:hypothetical protein
MRASSRVPESERAAWEHRADWLMTARDACAIAMPIVAKAVAHADHLPALTLADFARPTPDCFARWTS